jgi:glycosyltransferase involved in cell wall biosynthesis
MKHNILIFSEEYRKITKGLFVVWRNHVAEASKRNFIDAMLNQEHSAYEEAKFEFRANSQVRLHRLPLLLPGAWIRRAFRLDEMLWPLRVMGILLGRFLNLAVSPLVFLYLILRLRQLQPSAIFCHNGGWPGSELCRWMIVAAMLARIPKRIIVIHSYPAKAGHFFSRLLLAPFRFVQARLIDYCATSIVTVSESVKDTLEGIIFRHSVLRVHNGIPPLLPSFRSSDIPPLEWQPSGAVVGFVGALYPLKGPHVLLDAFKWVEVSCELALLGPADQHYLGSLKQRAQLCTNKVSFLGFHQDVDSFMQKIDVLVVPSIAFESFGMVTLEAMKHKKPVICSDFGGMKEIVVDGETGLVVPAGDELALANAITRLMEDTVLRRQMGEAGYRRLNELFTSERMAAQYDELCLGNNINAI